jgi:hypothetical protein
MKKTISFNMILLAAISSFNLSLSAEDAEIVGTDHDPLNPRFSAQAISRPSVMPTGIIALDTGAKVTGLKTVKWDIKTRFGIVEKLEGQFGYDGVTFNDPKATSKADFSPTINIGTKYNYLSINHISGSVSAKVPLHILDGEILRKVTFGLHTVFYNEVMAGGILDDVFSLTMRPNVEMAFNFDWWYGYQIYGNLWADINSSFGEIKMNNPDNQATWEKSAFWQKLPATLTLIYGFSPYFDVNANFGFDDTLEAKKTMKFGLGISVRGGRLFG